MAILLGGLFIFLPVVDTNVICYVFCIVLVIVGIVSMVLFFNAERYRKLQSYHFAIGVLLLIIGISSLLNVEHFSANVEMYMGLVTLILGTLILQSTVQLNLVGNKLWIVGLIFSIIVNIGVIPVLSGMETITGWIEGYVYWMLLIAGVLDLISMVLTWIGLKDKPFGDIGESVVAKTDGEAAEGTEGKQDMQN